MDLSGSKKISSISSLVNQKQGGGKKKAGIPSSIGVTNWTKIAYDQRGNGLLSLINMRQNRFKTFPNQNLPVGFRSDVINMR